MSNSKAVAERIKRLREERRNLMHQIEKVKEQADSEATNLESEVSMLREKLRIEELNKLPYSEGTTLEREVSVPREELRIDELNKLSYSEAVALENKISMLREDLRLLRIDIPRNERGEEADPNKKPRWHFLH